MLQKRLEAHRDATEEVHGRAQRERSLYCTGYSFRRFFEVSRKPVPTNFNLPRLELDHLTKSNHLKL